MKNHPRSTASLALMTVAAFIVIAWPSSAVANPPTQGRDFQVFRTGHGSADHQRALIYVVKTREAGDLGLVFLKTKGRQRGEGFVCALAVSKPNDGSYKCVQELGRNRQEILTIGNISSKFCKNLIEEIDNAECRDELLMSDGRNPVATPEECDEEFFGGECLCYNIRQDSEICNADKAPPNSGSGTGGHN